MEDSGAEQPLHETTGGIGLGTPGRSEPTIDCCQSSKQAAPHSFLVQHGQGLQACSQAGLSRPCGPHPWGAGI